jgi:hypothetical protein
MNKERHYCNYCREEKNHAIVGEPIQHSCESVSWTLWQCGGCDELFLLKETYSPSEDEESAYIEPILERIPPRAEYRLPGWVGEVDEYEGQETDYQVFGRVETSIRQIMREIYIALNHEAYNLACTGLRTVIDCVFRNKIGTEVREKAGLKEKLDAMVNAGMLTMAKAEIVDAVIQAGHASAHRGFTPPREILDQALQITEHLLQEIYIHPRCARAIKEGIPQG